jgi:hypothetical protein
MACDVSSKEVYERFVDIFKKADLPIVTDLNQWRYNPSVATVFFNIILMNNQDANKECFTLIMANAKSRANLAVPPVPQTRDVQILYWGGTRKIFTIQPIHKIKVFETIDVIANNFVEQFKAANTDNGQWTLEEK